MYKLKLRDIFSTRKTFKYQRILEKLREGNLTAVEGFKKAKDTHIAATVHYLRRKGYKITSVPFGSNKVLYKLEED